MKNTKNSLLMSVAAAALAASIGVAFAQAPSPTAGAQPSSPTEKTAPQLEPSKSKAAAPGMKSGQADEKKMEQKGSKAQSAQDNSKDGMKPKPVTSETKSPGKTSSDMKADTKTKADMKANANTPEKTGAAKPETTGQGAAAGTPKLSTEQRSTIHTAITQQKARPLTNVNFSISVGTDVPRSVHFYRVPLELVQIYPSWRGYDYILVGDQIIVVNPRTHRIVAVLEA